jgi:quercetin dioxygenase-like cupin family protein
MSEVNAHETPREGAHHVADPLIEIDCLAELLALQNSDSYRTADHAAKTIAKQPGIRVVLIALKPGGRLDEHHTDSPITVHGLKGNVNFTVAEKTFRLTPGVLLAVAWALPHSIEALDESAFLLTIGGRTGQIDAG